ncbi:MAG: 2-isopropylmalate synthase [Sulfolobales archaeon]|nr:2-isopropylmalate synthase [Sulfolobales archaeon]MCX8185904.1 2-isopropylmalate synthase [Sulfolobales archaeon]MDW7969161.1 2-isopropylmalate synthase [Sulfolobales archaeon]
MNSGFGLNSTKYVRILDTTLRDGEQTPGIALKPEDKLRIALALEELGVDSIEAGFPITSKGEFLAVKMIANEVRDAEVIALARSSKEDVNRVLDSGADAVHLFIATSDIHMKYKLSMNHEEVIEKAVESVDYAKSHGLIVEFSAEDSTRSRREFLVKVFQEVVNAGADRIDIADTVGVMTPQSMAELVRYVRNGVKGNYVLSVHCHNDFGMAVANSVTAVESGADQVHVTVLGVGERAGNAALEEVAAALTFLLGFRTNLRLELISSTAALVSELFDLSIQPNKPIVGINAFSHESGIHVHGILGNPLTYEPIDPSAIGMKRRIVLGKHSGKHAVAYMLKQLGLETNEEIVDEVLRRIKDLGDSGYRVDYEDFINIVKSVVGDLK